jgi:anti-sigma B factor antagonist
VQLSLAQRNGLPVATTTGPIDDSARDLFREHLHPLVAQGGAGLVLDLSGSSYVNSQGLGHLVTLGTHANTKGATLVLCGLKPHVAGVVTVTKLDRFFTIVPDVEQALAQLGAA